MITADWLKEEWNWFTYINDRRDLVVKQTWTTHSTCSGPEPPLYIIHLRFLHGRSPYFNARGYLQFILRISKPDQKLRLIIWYVLSSFPWNFIPLMSTDVEHINKTHIWWCAGKKKKKEKMFGEITFTVLISSCFSKFPLVSFRKKLHYIQRARFWVCHYCKIVTLH